MYANVVIPSDKAAWITAISKEFEVAVVAGCADVIRPCDVAKGSDTTLDSCWSNTTYVHEPSRL
jgi:hypothetical protein